MVSIPTFGESTYSPTSPFSRSAPIQLLAALAFAGSAVAQSPGGVDVARDSAVALWAGYSDSDNIGRTTIPEFGTYRSVGVLLGLTRETSRLEGSVSSDLEYRRYSVEGIENETVGNFNGRALVDLVEDRFAWSFEENLDQGFADPFAAIGPRNRESINVFTHGPSLSVPFGRTSLTVSASHSARRYDESTQIDNENDNYQLALSRTTSPTAVVALLAGTSETEYESDLVPTYEIGQLFLRIDKAQQHGQFTADFGTNEISSSMQSRRNPLLNLDWRRSLSSRSTLTLSASRGFTDSGSDIGSGGGVFVTSAPFEQKRLHFECDWDGGRTGVSLGAGIGEEDYAGGSSLDNEFQNQRLTVNVRASVQLEIGFRYEQYDRESPASSGLARSQDDRTAGIWLNRTLGEQFSVALDVSHYEGSGNDPIEETRTEIRFTYSPTRSASSALRSIGR